MSPHASLKDDSPSSSSQSSHHPSSSGGQPPTGAQSLQSLQQQQKKLLQQSPQQSKPSNLSGKDSNKDDKDPPKIKQEGQKPTMETQGPPPPPTSQYFLHPSFTSKLSRLMNPNARSFSKFQFSGPYPYEPIYRNMLVPGPPFNASPFHLQMARIPTPEDLSRNPNTKALDLLQHHASQYYNSHKIHELSERGLKSPTSAVKVSVSSPNVSQQPGPDRGSDRDRGGGGVGGIGDRERAQHSSDRGGGGLPPGMGGMPGNMPPGGLGPSQSSQQGGPKNLDKPLGDGPGGKDLLPSGSDLKDGVAGRSPPPQRHVHTHHHTHVGLGYPLGYPAPYGGELVFVS